MTRTIRIIIAIAVCLVLAAGAYFWALAQMDSVFAYRSPISANPPTPAEPANEAVTQRVVFVLVDALREDTSSDPAVMPYLAELRSQGAWAVMHSRPPSYSQPSYSVLMTGAWPELSDGPAMNVESDEIWTFTQDNIFSSAHRAGVKTAVSAFIWFEDLLPAEAVDASFYTIGEDAQADRDVLDAAVPWLQSGDYGLILIHLDQVDYAGHHEGGPQNENWAAAASRADALIKEIASYLDFSQDTLLVLSDHGQIDIGGHGGQDPITLIEPFVLTGKGVKPGQYPDVFQADVAPTVAVLLGANLPASAQGRPLVEMLDLTPNQLASIQNVHGQQQLTMFQSYLASLPDSGDIRTISSDPATISTEMNELQQSRLERERLPRAVLAVVLALLPALLIFTTARNRQTLNRRLWLLIAAALLVALFNLRYAVLDQKTYSMSSVISAVDLVMYAAITALLAYVVVWLLVTFAWRMFRQEPANAAEFMLDLGLAAIYLLSLFALLSFAINGPLVTWSLPEFNTWYLGFFALVQILMFAALTPLFSGLSALASIIARKRS